jgi:quercetin dioxygenase-like cupin family protein
MRILSGTVLAVLMSGWGASVVAGDVYPAQKLFSTGETTTGETIRYPESGAAKVTAQIVTIAPGAETVLHIHPTPMFAYILEGEVSVDYQGLGRKLHRAGSGFMEAMEVPHRGVNTGTVPVRILTVSMGAQGAADAQAASPQTADQKHSD